MLSIDRESRRGAAVKLTRRFQQLVLGRSHFSEYFDRSMNDEISGVVLPRVCVRLLLAEVVAPIVTKFVWRAICGSSD
jgi:hypothetical protein